MDTILIVGVESVVGANIAATQQSSATVVGVTDNSDIQIDGCRIIRGTGSIQQHLQAVRPDRIIFCGSSARSSWDGDKSSQHAIDDSLAIDWATAASESGIAFTMISSDAVFTGPWMSHAEDDTHFCETPQAERLRQIESEVVSVHADALIVRCNVFGWSPNADAPGFSESMLTALESGDRSENGFLCHAAPILASDFARILVQAHATGTTGLLHIGAAERINPYQFAERLADLAGLEPPQFPSSTTLKRKVAGFGCGETTLSSKRACALLGDCMPLVDEGIGRFLEQAESGFLASLRQGVGEMSRVA